MQKTQNWWQLSPYIQLNMQGLNNMRTQRMHLLFPSFLSHFNFTVVFSKPFISFVNSPQSPKNSVDWTSGGQVCRF